MLKVASWNVNSVHARLERVVEFLEREEPDVLCLQELKCETARFPQPSFEPLGYRSWVSGQKTYNGVAILTRRELTSPAIGLEAPEFDSEARVVSAAIDGIRVFSLYVPNGQEVGAEKYRFKLRWLKRLREFLHERHRPQEKLILAGDFNVAPEDRDCYDPDGWRGQILCSEPEREAFSSLLKLGLVDVFRKHHPESSLYSWWDYRHRGFENNHGLRLDFILATESLSARCLSARIDRNERKGPSPSDHAPVIADFDVSSQDSRA